MLPKLRQFIINNKITVGFIVTIVVLLYVGLTFFQNFKTEQQAQIAVPEEDLAFDFEGPFALLFPRRDGNALSLNLKRTASYDSISYELAYVSKSDDTGIQTKVNKNDGESTLSSEGVDRGVMGTLDTKSKKGEYEQEILFGTCSKNVCKYDKGVENGTLTLHIRKGDKAYKMVTQWHLQKPDSALGLLTSGDGHFSYKLEGKREELSLVGYSIINDLTGLPKLPDGKQAFGKVYALNVPIAKDLTRGNVSLELADNPGEGAKLARFDDTKNIWIEYDTKIAGGKLTAVADGAGVFAVLVPKR